MKNRLMEGFINAGLEKDLDERHMLVITPHGNRFIKELLEETTSSYTEDSNCE